VLTKLSVAMAALGLTAMALPAAHIRSEATSCRAQIALWARLAVAGAIGSG
jgi:hypothetical protein